MAGNLFGNRFRVATFGESHGAALGCVIDGCPSGLEISVEEIMIELNKRKPGQSEITTERKEDDKVEILSGVFNGITTGTPICMLVFNKDQKSADYKNIADIYRPAHGDFTYEQKYKIRDYRGGGRASGRETVARVMAGAVAKKWLKQKKISVVSYTKSIHEIEAIECDLDFIEKNPIKTCCSQNAKKMEQYILSQKSNNDSVGGVIETQVFGLPAGVGSPVFDKLEARLSQAIMSIGSVKGFEIGSGFAASKMLGSEHNDSIVELKNNKLKFKHNFSGGTLAGISTGDILICRCALKPTSSIKQMQQGANKKGELNNFLLEGRHDPCIVPRAVPVVEAMVALTLIDEILLGSI